MDTGILEFRKTPGGMGFSPTLFILWLRVILMDGDILRSGWSCLQFKRLGLSDEILRVVVGQF